MKKPIQITIFFVMFLSAIFATIMYFDTFPLPQKVLTYDGQGNHATHDSPTSRQLDPIENFWSLKNIWFSTIPNGSISDEIYQRNFYLNHYPGIALVYDPPITIKGIETDRMELVMENDIYMSGFYIRDAHTHNWHILYLKTDLNSRVNETIANLTE